MPLAVCGHILGHMTKKKSTTDTLPPPPASDAVEATPAENHPALVDAAGVVHVPLSEPCDLLSRALESCNELQHADFSATRHRAMTLIAEARALL